METDRDLALTLGKELLRQMMVLLPPIDYLLVAGPLNSRHSITLKVTLARVDDEITAVVTSTSTVQGQPGEAVKLGVGRSQEGARQLVLFQGQPTTSSDAPSEIPARLQRSET